MTRNNTLNNVHVAATELPQLLSQNTNIFGRRQHKVAVRLCAALKLTEKNKLLEVDRGHVPQCPIAGDANESVSDTNATTLKLLLTSATSVSRWHNNY